MKKLLLMFVLVILPIAVKADMYDDHGNRIFGRQNYMRHGTYDPRVPPQQFKEKRVSVQKIIKRSLKQKRKYIRCDLSQNSKYQYRLNLLKFKQGAHRQCQEDVRYILKIPYRTKNKKSLRSYEWKSKGY